MAEVIRLHEDIMGKPIYFAVYELPVIDVANNYSHKRYIVMKNSLGIIVCFTAFEQYAGTISEKKRVIRTRSKSELEYICRALNCILIYRNPINTAQSVARVTKETVLQFFEIYRTEKKPDGSFRSQQSIDNCVRSVSSFFANAMFVSGGSATFQSTELYQEAYVKANINSRKVIRQYVPLYQEAAIRTRKNTIFRDIPVKVMEVILEQCQIHAPEIYFAVVSEITTGIRPGEAMNMRREDSLLGSGLFITMRGSSISTISIDLQQELKLRSDNVEVGKIKKERVQKVYPAYISIFYQAYRWHQQHMIGKKYEKDYGSMFVNRSGKALTVKSYREKFSNLIRDKVCPVLLKSENVDQQIFAQRLQSEKLSPHALRHFFTVSLVLCGEGIAQLQYYRGDSSPVSALWYLQNKGELTKVLGAVHNDVIGGLMQIGCEESNEPDL